ncbi:MAG: aldehyde dehydrogenase family protein [Candidatus Thermoplasmatota archaeon]|nr:aldehyde dehydrogenase family protein [Candidatus Thermoplasmatota archaeon]MCL5666135.1 aldehyde dehydrogenase family protein [Candidatus Thermoplasmatota archaeon]
MNSLNSESVNVKKVREAAFQDLGIEERNAGVYAGRWIGTEKFIKSVSPIDSSTLGFVGAGGEGEFREVVGTSLRAFDEWKEMPATRRGEIVGKIGMKLQEKKRSLGLMISLEAGKVITEGQGEIQEMIDVANFCIGLSRQLYGLTMTSERPFHRLMEQWVPLGPVAVITSFNFPASVWSWNAFVASVAGDSVVWKPSSKVPMTSIAIMKIVESVMEEESAPPVFSLINGSGESVGNLILNEGSFPLVSFTGSVESGRLVSQKVASRLGRTILELGGNNAAIISGTADPEISIKGVSFGALATAGQRCTSTRRAIIHESIYERTVNQLKEVYEKAKIGNPLHPDTLVGPLIDRGAVKKFRDALEQAVREGGKILTGGDVIQQDNGYYVKPALVEANNRMKIWREETFAPILYVFKYKNFGEAIELNNTVRQGLSTSLFTSDLNELGEFLSAHGADTGLVNINTATAGAEIGGAFGGEKDTGGGRESGSDAWKNYMRRQTVTLNYGKSLPLSQNVDFHI